MRNEQFPAGKVLEEYQNKIYHLALSISRNEKDAEDIVQNTFVKILRKLPTFSGRAKLSTWVYRVAYNESLMFLRKKRRIFNSSDAYLNYAKRLPAGLSVNWSKLQDEELLDKELRSRVDSALKDTPIQYRMPMLLHHNAGFSIYEIAKILGIKAATVKTRLHRAYLIFKEKMSAYFNDLPEREVKEDKSCGLWNRFLFDYAKEELSFKKREAFNRHIKDCPRCNAFLGSYLKAIKLTGALSCRDIPEELKANLKTFLLRRKNT